MVSTIPNTSENPFIAEAVLAARYMTNSRGQRTDIVLPISIWEKLLQLLESLDDRSAVQEWLPRLKAGPIQAGALRWEDVANQWSDEDEAV